MSIGQDVATGLDAAGGLALSQSINMPVGDESTFGHDTAFYRTSTVVNHPDTNDVMSGKSPWMVAVGAPGAASGEHVRVTWQCSDDADMSAVEDAMTGTEPFFITRFVFDAANKRVEAYGDGSAYWTQTDWVDPHIPWVPDWETVSIRSLLAGSSLFCTMPSQHRYDWSRRVKPVLSGTAETITKSGNNACYILSLHADIAISGTTYPSGQFIQLNSNSVVATPSADTIIMKVYR